jgi:hypothetical protein
MAHQARWGWYPCDYATFQLLKALNARCEKARRRFAEWRRWKRKMPHNRLLRRRLVDEDGRKIGVQIVGPKPEPLLDPLFCQRCPVVRHWTEDGRHLREAETVERVSFCDRGIPQAYGAARRPVPCEKLVPPLPLTPKEIRRLAAQAGGQGSV